MCILRTLITNIQNTISTNNSANIEKYFIISNFNTDSGFFVIVL